MTTGYQAAAGARRAASLLLLRDGDSGLEVLMLRRAERDGDLRSGAAVFPGGVLDARDRDAHRWCLGPTDADASAQLGLAEGGLDYLVAAVREAFEEVGQLLAVHADGRPLQPTRELHAALHPWRSRLNDGHASVAELCAEFDLRLDLRGLAYTSHWLTPPGVPKRFDTRFFTAPAPVGQQAEADYGEAVELMWLTAAAARDPARGLKLLPVTDRLLHALGRHATTEAALAEVRQLRVVPLVMPHRALGRKGLRILMPDDPAYAEVARLDPLGRADVSCEIVPGVPVRLSPRVIRLTAPNPGMMTGPGTNTYFVGGGEDWTVIDPGPADALHLQAMLAAVPGRITRIIATHTHMDHSPGAAALAAATGAELLGRRAPPHGGQDQSFAPARELAHGERLAVGGGGGGTLRVIHTPGHASNHVCLLLEEEKTLFTGDHVMQGSTVVINPPDGDMVAYLRALAGLLEEDLDWLAPGHGFLVAQPHAVVRALIEHRLRREAKVVEALRQAGPGAIDALLPQAYADVPAALHPVARRSLLAHLLKLQADGQARLDGEVWALA